MIGGQVGGCHLPNGGQEKKGSKLFKTFNTTMEPTLEFILTFIVSRRCKLKIDNFSMMFVSRSCVACETKPQTFEPKVVTPCFFARKIHRTSIYSFKPSWVLMLDSGQGNPLMSSVFTGGSLS